MSAQKFRTNLKSYRYLLISLALHGGVLIFLYTHRQKPEKTDKQIVEFQTLEMPELPKGSFSGSGSGKKIISQPFTSIFNGSRRTGIGLSLTKIP
jgi:hypothetical protein